MPPWRVVKERRATFAATAAQERLRPGPRTDLPNLVLAGDWTATGLPGDDRRCHQVRPNRGRGAARRLRTLPCRRETSLTRETAPDERLHDAIARAGAALARQQHADGHWLFELEADATIPAEYVLLEHFLDRIDPALEAKIGVYLRVDPGRARRLAAVP